MTLLKESIRLFIQYFIYFSSEASCSSFCLARYSSTAFFFSSSSSSLDNPAFSCFTVTRTLMKWYNLYKKNKINGNTMQIKNPFCVSRRSTALPKPDILLLYLATMSAAATVYSSSIWLLSPFVLNDGTEPLPFEITL